MAQERLFLTQNILSLQELITIDQIQGISLMQQGAEGSTIWQSLSVVASEMISNKRLYQSLSQVSATMMTDISQNSLLPAVLDSGHPPLNVPPQDAYVVLKEWVYFYSFDGTTTYRLFFQTFFDATFFAYTELPLNDFTSINQWMGPVGCGSTTFNVSGQTITVPISGGPSATSTPTSANFTCNCYTSLIVQTTTDPRGLEMLNKPLSYFTSNTNSSQKLLTNQLQVPTLASGTSDSPYDTTLASIAIVDYNTWQETLEALCLTAVRRMRVFEDSGTSVADILLDNYVNPTLQLRPYCDTTPTNIYPDLVQARNTFTAGQGPRLLSVPYDFYNGLVTSMYNMRFFLQSVAELTAGACPTPLNVQTTRETLGLLGNGVNPTLSSVTSGLNQPAVMYNRHSLPVQATSPDAIPVNVLSNKQIHTPVVFNATQGSLLINSAGTSSIVSVEILNAPFDPIPPVFNWAGYFQCISIPCPQRVLTLNATTGKILSTQQVGPNTTDPSNIFYPNIGWFHHVYDIDPSTLPISRLNAQRANTPASFMEFVEPLTNPNTSQHFINYANSLSTLSSINFNLSLLNGLLGGPNFYSQTSPQYQQYSATILKNLAVYGAFVNHSIGFYSQYIGLNQSENGYQFRRPVTTIQALEAATGTQYNPDDATVSASTFMTQVAWNPTNNLFDYRCNSQHGTVAFGPCAWMDMCFTKVFLAQGKIRCYLRAPYQLRITVQVPGNVTVPVPSIAQANCPTSFQPLQVNQGRVALFPPLALLPCLVYLFLFLFFLFSFFLAIGGYALHYLVHDNNHVSWVIHPH